MSDQSGKQLIFFMSRSLVRDFTEMCLHSYAVLPPILERLVANKGRWPVGYANGDFWCRPLTKGGFELPEPFRDIWTDGQPSFRGFDYDDEGYSNQLMEQLELFQLHLGLYDPDLL